MASRHALLFWLTLATAPLGTTGCFFFADGDPGKAAEGPTATEQDVAQYDTLQAQLEQQRTVFKHGGQSQLAGIGSRLFWLEFPASNPTLHSFEATSGQEIDYGFSIGSGDDYDYRASEDLVVSAENTGDMVVFHAFAAGEGQSSLGDLSVPAPGGGVKRWAYAPDGHDLYYVTTGPSTTLWKWTPGQASPKRLLDLEDAGAQVGDFQDFGVDGNAMVFIESGRIWSLDIAAKKATWLGNKTEATGAWPGTDGVLFPTADGPFFYSYGSKDLTDVGRSIAMSSYVLNTTFSSADLYDHDLARNGSLVAYVGKSGVFTFDLKRGTVAPVLLDARDDSTVYRHPVLLSDGSLFVQGLASDDGAIGADGPIYRVHLGR